MVVKDYQKTKGSTKVEVGEIDTSAPFQSVKDAVCLFGERAFSGGKPTFKKPKPQSAERPLAKETQLHLAQKELSELHEQIKNAETTKCQALSDLEKAKRTVEDLTQKLITVNESKDSATRAGEVAKNQAKQVANANNGNSEGTEKLIKIDQETGRVQYVAAARELDVAKQELRTLYMDYDASAQAKDAAAKKEAEAENLVDRSTRRLGKLSEEIASVWDSIKQVELSTKHTKEEEKKISAEKDKQELLYKARLRESVKELLALKKNVDLDIVKDLETQLADTLLEAEALRNEMDGRRTSDLDSLKAVTSELYAAKELLHKVADKESLLRSLVDTLKLDLDNVKKQCTESKEKEAETKARTGNLHVKLRRAKCELEEALAEETKIRGASDEMVATIQQLASESEKAKFETEKLKQETEELKREAEAAKIKLQEAETKLKLATHEAEEAKATEARAIDQIKILSEQRDSARTAVTEPGARITISRDEYISLSQRVAESERIAEMKVEAAIAQVAAVVASQNEANEKYEEARKEIEAMKAATEAALRKAEKAEAARGAVEGELKRWREREQKKATEAASFQPSPLINCYQIQKQKSLEKTRKLEKAKTWGTKKVVMPRLSSLFRTKKNRVEGGAPSFLPGEKPVW